MGTFNLYKTYQTKSKPFYDFFLIGHIADKDVYNHVTILTYRTGGLIGQKPNPVPYPKLLNWLESKKQRIYESDYAKQTLFYNFPLNIRVQMQFQGHQPCSELRPPVLETSCRFSLL